MKLFSGVVAFFLLSYIIQVHASCNYIEEYCGTSKSGVVVHWKWVSEAEGLIEWTFNNTGKHEASVILNRGATYNGVPLVPPYVFAAAYFPAYLYDGLAQYFYGNLFLSETIKLTMICQLGKFWTVFVFTLAPGQVFRMEEGGYVYDDSNIFPYCQNVDDITYQGSGVFKIKYNVKDQCTEFDPTQPCPPETFQAASAYYSIEKGLVNSSNFWPSAGDVFESELCVDENIYMRRTAEPQKIASSVSEVERMQLKSMNDMTRQAFSKSNIKVPSRKMTRII
eukprot:jgi/Galph1/771/GphlegSOOS_G5527.1